MPKLKVKHVKKLPDLEPNEVLLQKVISGGQDGAGIAALRAAKKSNFKTGGYMPQGFITKSGPKPGYGWMYHLIDDTPSIISPYNSNLIPDYKARTWKNVVNSDATFRLAWDFDSPGERCTLDALRYYKRPFLDIFMEKEYMLPPEEVAEWIVKNEIQILNVAGNATKEIEQPVENYLLHVFFLLRWA